MPRELTEQEYNTVRDHVLKSAPPNMDEATYARWVGPQMQAAIVEAELKPPMQQDSAAWRFASNAASMLNPVTIAEGVYGLARHPIDSATAMAGQMGDQWQEAGTAAREGRYSEAAGHAVAGSIPLIGPTAAKIGEQAAEGDVAGAAGAFTGLVAPALVMPAVRGTTRAVRAIAPEGLRATVAEIAATKAAQNISEVMRPTVGPNKLRFGNMAEQVAPELAQRPELAAWTRAGFGTKVRAGFDAAITKLDEATNARLSARTFNTQPLIDGLKKARSRWVSEPVEASKFPKTGDVPEAFGKEVIPPENSARVARIDQAIADLEQLGPSAKYESLRRIREAADQSAKIKYSPSVTQDFLKASGNASGSADVAGVFREHLAKFDPRTAAANQEYALFKKTTDVLDAVEEVERSRPKVGRNLIAKWAGAATGGEAAGAKGAVIGYVLGPVVENIASATPTMKLQTAKLLTQLSEALRQGQTARALSLSDQLKRGATMTAGIASRSTAGVAPAPTAAPSQASQ